MEGLTRIWLQASKQVVRFMSMTIYVPTKQKTQDEP